MCSIDFWMNRGGLYLNQYEGLTPPSNYAQRSLQVAPSSQKDNDFREYCNSRSKKVCWIKENEFLLLLKRRNRSGLYSYGKRQQWGEKEKRRAVEINLIIDIQNSSCDMCWYRVSETGREGLGHWLDHRLSGELQGRLLDPGDEYLASRTCSEPSTSYPMVRRTHQDWHR